MGTPSLRIGTSSWSSADWIGPFYPPGSDAASFLAHYATEQRLSGDSAELQGRVAVALARHGDLAAAQQALQRAVSSSNSAAEQQRYTAKLARLREQGRL